MMLLGLLLLPQLGQAAFFSKPKTPQAEVHIVNTGKAGLALRLNHFMSLIDPRYEGRLNAMLQAPLYPKMSNTDHLIKRLTMGYVLPNDYAAIHSVVLGAIETTNNQDVRALGNEIIMMTSAHISPQKMKDVISLAFQMSKEIGKGSSDIDMYWPNIETYIYDEGSRFRGQDERFIYVQFPINFEHKEVFLSEPISGTFLTGFSKESLNRRHVEVIIRNFNSNRLDKTDEKDHKAMAEGAASFVYRFTKVIQPYGWNIIREINITTHPDVKKRLYALLGGSRVKVVKEP